MGTEGFDSLHTKSAQSCRIGVELRYVSVWRLSALSPHARLIGRALSPKFNR